MGHGGSGSFVLSHCVVDIPAKEPSWIAKTSDPFSGFWKMSTLGDVIIPNNLLIFFIICF